MTAPADDAQNLLSGLAGGLIGAVIGAGVTVWVQWREHRHEGEIAARAVHAEMAGNVTQIRLLLATASTMAPVVMHAWLARAADVARLLPADEFYRVAMAYALLPECERIQNLVAARGTVKPDEESMLAQLLPTLSETNEILRKRAWKRGEAPTLEGISPKRR